MAKYLLDTNAYFALLKYVVLKEQDDTMEDIISGDCYISKLTQIEIISVIGQYARGSGGQSAQICNRIHEGADVPCGKRYIVEKRRKWSQRKTHDWLKLEKEISSGRNPKILVNVLDVDEGVVKEAEAFIQNALMYNFKSMDAMILGTARAFSTEEETMTVVTADRGLKAGMKHIGYPYISVV